MSDSSVVMTREVCHGMKMSSVCHRQFPSTYLPDIGFPELEREIVVPGFPRFQYVSPELDRIALLIGFEGSAVLVVYELHTGSALSEIHLGNGTDDPLLLLRVIDWTGDGPVLSIPDRTDGASG